MTKDAFRAIVSPYTMTTTERVDCLFSCMEQIRIQQIPGDYVECGVWRGGNILGMMRYLEWYNHTTPTVWLYDTFSGMTAPGPDDIDLHNQNAADILSDVLCLNSLEDVQRTLSTSQYPSERVRYVVGDVCNTLRVADNVPDRIALLRLDTDWYESTKIELEVLWDRLAVGAPCIIDDFGHWQGCSKAVREFFDARECQHEAILIDYTGIVMIKKC